MIIVGSANYFLGSAVIRVGSAIIIVGSADYFLGSAVIRVDSAIIRVGSADYFLGSAVIRVGPAVYTLGSTGLKYCPAVIYKAIGSYADFRLLIKTSTGVSLLRAVSIISCDSLNASAYGW